MKQEGLKAHTLSRPVISWVLYDWANSAYALCVMSAFFPIFLKEYWNSTADDAITNFQLGIANSVASLIIVLAAPLLGAVADQGRLRKRFLFSFAALGALTCGSLFLVSSGSWQIAVVLYILGTVGFSGANVFYDALLVAISPPDKRDWVSALGYSVGYLGGGILFAFSILMMLYPGWFGLAGPAEAIRLSFLMVAAWWALFSLPLLLLVAEPDASAARAQPWKAGFRQLKKSLSQIRKLRPAVLFLVAYWLYIDGVDTIIRMAVAYGQSLGLDRQHLILALLMSQLLGFPAALAVGKIVQYIGPRRVLFGCLAVYGVITTAAVFVTNALEFYLLAASVALVQGGIQSVSRSYYTRLIPASQAGEFFGFYNMLGKFAAVLGPLLMGSIGLLTGNVRTSILTLLVLFAGGAFFLSKVDEEEARQAVAAMER